MIGRIYAIAINTFRQAQRNRILYGIIGVVVGLNLFAIVMGEMSLHEQARVARDIGLSAVSFFGSVVAIVLAVWLLYGEVHQRWIHTLLSKPLERFEFVLGKYLGMGAMLTLLVVAFAIAMAGLLFLQDVAFTVAIAKALILSYMEVLVVAAIAVFFSSFSSWFLAAVFSMALWFAGRLTPEMREAIDTTENPVIRKICAGALKVLPDMNLFSISGNTVQGEVVSVHQGDFVSWLYVSQSVGYALVYIAIMLILAISIFSRRDFV